MEVFALGLFFQHWHKWTEQIHKSIQIGDKEYGLFFKDFNFEQTFTLEKIQVSGTGAVPNISGKKNETH